MRPTFDGMPHGSARPTGIWCGDTTGWGGGLPCSACTLACSGLPGRRRRSSWVRSRPCWWCSRGAGSKATSSCCWRRSSSLASPPCGRPHPPVPPAADLTLPCPGPRLCVLRASTSAARPQGRVACALAHTRAPTDISRTQTMQAHVYRTAPAYRTSVPTRTHALLAALAGLLAPRSCPSCHYPSAPAVPDPASHCVRAARAAIPFCSWDSTGSFQLAPCLPM